MSLPRPFSRLVWAAAGLSFPTLAWAQRLGQAADPDIAWWRVLAALALCLGLAVAAALALRSRLRGVSPGFSAAASRQLRLLESLRLSHQVDVCLVECDQRRVLVATSPHGVVLLSSEVSAGPPPSEASP